MPRHDRLAIARSAVEILVPLLRSNGQYHPSGVGGPSRWTLEWRGLTVSLVGQVLLLPDHGTPSSLLDIWPAKGQKALSVRWIPSQPWLPPQVVSFRPGEWLIALDRTSEPTVTPRQVP